MRKNFLVSSIKLIILGVALGFLARYFFGDPIASTDHGRQFNSPVNADAIEPEPAYELPDFPLPQDWTDGLP